MKRRVVFLSLATLCLSSTEGVSQTTFTGAISQTWSEGGNWTNGLPAPGNDANIPSDKTTIVYSDSLAIPFVVENSGTIKNYGTIYITGAINNFGTIYSGEDEWSNHWIYNEGVITNYEGILTNINGLHNGELGVIVNYDTITNTGGWDNFGATENEPSGTILNQGHIDIEWSGSLVNKGTLENDYWFWNRGVIENNGLILNFDECEDCYACGCTNFHNSDTLNNNADGTISNYSHLANTGIINQCGTWIGFEPDLSNPNFLPYTTDDCTSATGEGDLSFLMFPNPTRNELTLQLQGFQQIASIQIKDAAGRTVLKTNKVATENAITLGLSSLRPGVYSVQVSCGFVRAVHRLIIER